MNETVHHGRRQFLKRVGAVGLSSAAALIVDGCTSPPTSARVPCIGVLTQSSDFAVLDPFRQGLRDLGYIPGENITVEYRYARGPAGDQDLTVPYAAELVSLNLDLIVAGGTNSAIAARNATTAIPIVAVIVADPVGNGLVASMARPAGNLTGFTNSSAGLSAKRLELLTQAIPTVRRVGAMGLPSYFTSGGAFDHGSWWQETNDAARVLGVEVVAVKTSGPDDLARAFEAARTERVDALVTAPDATLFTNHVKIAMLALQTHMPALFVEREYVDAGGLMNYGPNFADTWRRAAGYVDRILKGAKPADLPVEEPRKFDLVINLRTAAAFGLTIPQSVLAQASDVLR